MNGLFERWFGIGVVGCVLLSGCNLSDPVSALPRQGCADNSDCNDHGACNVTRGVGTCVCNVGYVGEVCGECDDGYEEDAPGLCVESATNVVTNNNTNNPPVCESDEVLLDDQCVSDSCAPNPCGDGTCAVTGEGTWECDCTDGSTGTDCPTCDDDCINGACDDTDTCICAAGWDGPTCEACALGYTGADCATCAANAYGPNCETCAQLTSTEPWWDTAYAGRQGLVLYNRPTAGPAVLDGVALPYMFQHDQLVQNGGADPTGRDFRVVSSLGEELDRVLGFDSGWNQPDTTVWFPTPGRIDGGQIDMVFMYARNSAALDPLNDAANVLRQDRGWYHGPGGPVYSANADLAGQYSLQLRQRDTGALQMHLYDGGNDNTALAVLEIFRTTGTLLETFTFGANRGSGPVPVSVFEEYLPPIGESNLLIRVTLDAGTTATANPEDGAIFLGAQQVASGTGQLTYQATISRAVNTSAMPEIIACPTETAP